MELRLTDAVRTLREELTEAVEEAEAQSPDMTFTVGPVQMDFEVQFRVDGKAKGKLSAWIASGEIEAGASRTRTHRVSFTLTPRPKDTPDGDVSITSTAQTTHAAPPPSYTR
ncbi:trypco2 family protein [Nocardiopsis sp. YSL2]|uniref:trypco2 family protein n=1 Tax=Nocardiopsis sp. YSL2 TaxID=2939492 RepID=UPI0026F40E4A|nr:trypco2 family protein [Nocardiopsis sp. YSL2]